MDTVIQLAHNKPGLIWAAASANRRDHWPSRAVAAEKMRSNPAFQVWDSRILEKYIEYGLRELPTELYPDVPTEGVPVTLQTTKAQEQYNYIKATYNDDRLLLEPGAVWNEFYPKDRKDVEGQNFSRSENKMLWHRLPELKPSVLYIPGERSGVSGPELRRERLEVTGTGPGGSGGLEKGRVKEKVIEDAGHLVPFEKPREAAEASAEFLSEELERWGREDEERRERWGRLSRRERVDINEKWREGLGIKKKEGKGKTGPPPEKL